MSGYNRYKILKKSFNNYCIIFINNSYGIDKEILKDINKSISYIIVDNLTIIKIYNSYNNQYNKYFYYECLKTIIFSLFTSA